MLLINLLKFIFIICFLALFFNTVNSDGGYEAYSGVETESTIGEIVKVPSAPIEPPRLTPHDAEILKEAAESKLLVEAFESHNETDSNVKETDALLSNNKSFDNHPPSPPPQREILKEGSESKLLVEAFESHNETDSNVKETDALLSNNRSFDNHPPSPPPQREILKEGSESKLLVEAFESHNETDSNVKETDASLSSNRNLGYHPPSPPHNAEILKEAAKSKLLVEAFESHNETDSNVKETDALLSNNRSFDNHPPSPPLQREILKEGSESKLLVEAFESHNETDSNVKETDASLSSNRNLGYHPPPPPTRREIESKHQCFADLSKWQIEPQSVISHAIMFDRTTGLTCEQCLTKCINEFQNQTSQLVCRSLTYDHIWKICDLYAVQGTEHPYFLVDYDGRDYFSYLDVLPPTDEQLKTLNTEYKSELSKKNFSLSNAFVETEIKKNYIPLCSSPALSTPNNNIEQNPTVDLETNNHIQIHVTPAPSLGGYVNSSISANKKNETAYNNTELSSLETVKVIESALTTTLLVESTPSTTIVESSNNLLLKNNNEIINKKISLNNQNLYSEKQKYNPENLKQEQSLNLKKSNSYQNKILENLHNEDSNNYINSYNNSDKKNEIIRTHAAKTQQQLVNKVTKTETHFSQKNTSFEQTNVQHHTLKIHSLNNNKNARTNYSKNKNANIDDFESVLESLRNQLQKKNSSSEIETIESDTGSSAFSVTSNSFQKPKTLKILKTTSSNLPNKKHFKTEWNSVSIHTIPIIGNTDGKNEKIESSAFIQEAKTSQSAFNKLPNSKSTSSFSNNGDLRKNNLQEITNSNGLNCEPGYLSHYILFDGYQRSKEYQNDKILYAAAKNIDECIEACDNQQSKFCASIVFSDALGCELFSDSVNHRIDNVLVNALNTQYIEKSCIPIKFTEGLNKVSVGIPKHILVGHVQEVIDAKTFVECQIACLRSEFDFGFVCRSAMWYPQDSDQNCLLNAENKQTQPEVFVTEDAGVVMLYFELSTVKPYSTLKSTILNKKLMRFKDAPLQGEKRTSILNKDANKKFESIKKWTRWSSDCKYDEQKNSTVRVRYLKCNNEKDVRKCLKESIACKNTRTLQIKKLPKDNSSKSALITNDSNNNETKANITSNIITKNSECRAVRDAIGRTHCPYGMRYINGRREFCKAPIDC